MIVIDVSNLDSVRSGRASALPTISAKRRDAVSRRRCSVIREGPGTDRGLLEVSLTCR